MQGMVAAYHKEAVPKRHDQAWPAPSWCANAEVSVWVIRRRLAPKGRTGDYKARAMATMQVEGVGAFRLALDDAGWQPACFSHVFEQYAPQYVFSF